MSWSVTATGKPEALAAYLEKYAENLTGQSKEEYLEALPHMIGLVKCNKISPDNANGYLKIEASGHGQKSKKRGEEGWTWDYNTVQVKITQEYISLIT